MLIKFIICSVLLFNLLAVVTNTNADTSTKNDTSEHNNNAVILLYHHVSNDTPKITSVSPEIFEQQLDYIEQNNFSVWPLEKIIDHINNGMHLPKKTLAISFDDAYESIYTEAYPRLKARNMPFTIFVTTESVDRQYNQQLDWQSLNTMQKNGASLANHTVTHPHMLYHLADETDQQWQQRMKHEVIAAQQRLEEKTASRLKLFAYPYGEHNKALKNIIRDLGFIGFGQQSGALDSNTDLQSIPRFPIAGNYIKMDDFGLKINTLAMPATDISQQDNPLKHEEEKPLLKLAFQHAVDKNKLQCFGTGQGKLTIEWDGLTAMVKPQKSIPVGRSRYNCTLAHADGRYHWFSKPWIRLKANDEWILD